MNKLELEKYLLQLSEFLKNQNTKYEIILVGGGAILLNHNFRKQTQDVDIIGIQDDVFQKAINDVADKYNIDKEWMNYDFMKTSSYSKVLEKENLLYKNYSNTLTVKTISDDIIVTMKLKAYREYRTDRSDIIEIIHENPKITYKQIENDCIKLYGNTNAISKKAWDFLDKVLLNKIDFYENMQSELEANKKIIKWTSEFDSIMNFGTEEEKEKNIKMIIKNVIESINDGTNDISEIKTVKDEFIKFYPKNKKLIECIFNEEVKIWNM